MRAAYGAGHFAKSLAWSFTDLLLAYYLNVRMGLSAQQTGLLLFSSMALGAGLDVSVAFILRRAEGSRRQILTIQLIAGLATAAALVGVFSPRAQGASLLYLVPALALFRFAFSFYDVAQNALVSLLPADDVDAQRYVVWRQALSALARIGVAALGFLLLGDGDGGWELPAAGAIGLLIVASSAWIFKWSAAPSPERTMGSTAWLPTPPGLARLLLAAAALAGPMSLGVRMVTFVTGPGSHAHDGAALLFAFVFGTLIGPLVPRKRAVIAYTMLTVLAAMLFLADTRSGLTALFACFAHGVGLGALMTLFWGTTSAAIRDHAERSGVRTDIAAFALVTATIKLSGAVAGLVLGLLLDGFKAADPATMAVLAGITAAGGLVFVLTGAPPRRGDAPG